MRNKIQIAALFILTSLLVSSCLEVAPRNRPTFSPYAPVIDEPEDTDKNFEIPTRPDGAVYLQAGGCGCQNGEPITLGNCAAVCDSKPATGEEVFFLDVKLGEEISTSSFKNLAGWCRDPISYVDPETEEVVTVGTQAACVISYKDEYGLSGEIGIEEADIGPKSLRFKLSTLEPDKTYRVQIVETTSGASSDVIQIRKVSDRIGDPIGGPLWQMPVNQYSCLTRSTSTDQNSGDSFFESANRNHYYFIDEDRPEPLPEAYANIYCHDYQIYGTTPINRPLLEESPHFTIWDKWDPRFWPDYEDPADNELLIHKLLGQKIRDLGYGDSENPKVFFPLEYYNGPPISDGETSVDPKPKKLGFYMLPYIDKDTYKAYCPTAEHYNSDNPLFQAMRETVAVDTEGLYIAKQDNVCDIMLINEAKLKKIWFYIDNGQHIEPNRETIQGKQVQFYWPPDYTSPYVKKSHQRVYTIKLPTEQLCDDGNNVSDQANQQNYYPAHDKRIGCVPALTE